MGYSHYWTIRKEVPAKGWKAAIAACNKVIKNQKGMLADGFSEKAVAILPKEIWLNGVKPLDHETFFVKHEELGEHNFCKTNGKPYDVVVTACLAILWNALPGYIEVSSDGGPGDWRMGVELASSVLKTKLANPLG